MSLQDIKNEYARKQGFANWNELLKFCYDSYLNHYIDQVMKIYAIECLKIANKNLSLEECGFDGRDYGITNEKNIIK